MPVIGIGNIVSGGSGKTPFTLALAKAALRDGLDVAVSHRGYKGLLESSPTVISRGEGPLFPASVCGDEAWLIAASLPSMPVVVGKDRLASIALLEALEPKPSLLLMDDVFQNHKVFKDIQIACFDAGVGIGNGRVIPAGYLREDLSALKRADLCLISRKDPPINPGPLLDRLGKWCRWCEVLDYSLTSITDASGAGLVADPNMISVLVSGIASPTGFEELARTAGINWTRHFGYRDHYHYQSREELKPLLDHIKREGVQRLYCTAKDLPKLARHRDLAPLLAVLHIGPSQERVQDIWQGIRKRLEERDQSR